MSPDNLVQTAYDFDTSSVYDQKRFTSPQGCLFDKMEREQFQRVLKAIPTRSKVMEVGSGTGRFGEMVLAQGHSYVGAEPSPYMIDIARNRLHKASTAFFVEGEGAVLPFPQHSFDFTYAIRVLNQTESEDYALQVVQEMIRVTKPGGTILVEFCNKWRPRRVHETGTRLSVPQIVTAIRENSSVYISLNGILFLSETLLQRTPEKFLGIFYHVDRVLSLNFLLAARCYVVINLASHEAQYNGPHKLDHRLR